MPQGVVLIGVQWGDEGKGKIVDYYSEQVDIVGRFQGGNNAGHTIVVEGETTILHLIPSGILHPHTLCMIGSGVVVDPEIFLHEIEVLEKAGINTKGRILLSDRAHLILDYHKHLDAARENRRAGSKIGTTKRGIGPAYEDRASRRGLRVVDLLNPERFRTRLEENLEEKNFLLKELYKTDPLPAEGLAEKYRKIGEKISPYIADVAGQLHDMVADGKRVFYEGAQGILLDIDYGTYPYVTSSHTLPSQAALGLGARLPKDTLFIAVMKAYTTRVGEGPFPTELDGAEGEHLRKVGAEFGATTGRPRRCGWLDLVAVKYALRTCGITNLAVTKVDVLNDIEEIKVCTGYRFNGEVTDRVPADTAEWEKLEPIYETLPGWSGDLSTIKNADQIPKNLKNYLKFIEDFTGTTVNLISTGAGREAVVDIKNLFS